MHRSNEFASFLIQRQCDTVVNHTAGLVSKQLTPVPSGQPGAGTGRAQSEHVAGRAGAAAGHLGYFGLNCLIGIVTRPNWAGVAMPRGKVAAENDESLK